MIEIREVDIPQVGGLRIEYVYLPFIRIRPYREGVNPLDASKWPNEPNGFIFIPVVCTEDMTKEDIQLKAMEARSKLFDEWLELGNCYKEEAA